MSETVLVEQINGVYVLTLNRPDKLNAANLEMQQRLVECVRAISQDSDARALILTGAGRAFSSGGDRSILREIAEQGKANQHELLAQIHTDTILGLLELSIPIIAAVPGPAVGYAAGLVALCDFVVMGEDGFLCDPHVGFGTAATTAVQIVWPLLTSLAVAKELMMTGRRVGAEEALRLGLANRVCAQGDELGVAMEMAAVFCKLPPEGVAATKRSLNRKILAEAAEHLGC